MLFDQIRLCPLGSASIERAFKLASIIDDDTRNKLSESTFSNILKLSQNLKKIKNIIEPAFELNNDVFKNL